VVVTFNYIALVNTKALTSTHQAVAEVVAVLAVVAVVVV
jgi:hypothetical protein